MEAHLFETGTENVAAIVTDMSVETDMPAFKRDAIDEIADFIEKFF